MSDSNSSRDEVFNRILRKLQREENFGAGGATGRRVSPTRGGGQTSTAVTGGGAHAMLTKQLGATKEAKPGEEGYVSRLTIDRQEAEERTFGAVPAPATLRAVLDSVRQTIGDKLELARLSPLRDTMRLVFECRTMLDKLL
jgi:hypothetical protein